MKRTAFYITIVFGLIGLITSCSVYEELYFAKNGNISYKLTFDSEQLMQMMPKDSASENSIPSDSIISFAELINKMADNENISYPEEKEDLENISRFSIRKFEDAQNKVFTFTILGDFDNDEQLNKAFFSMNRLMGKTSDTENSLSLGKSKIIDQFNQISQYKWDGKQMERYTINIEIPEADIDEEALSDEDEAIDLFNMKNPFSTFLMGSKMQVKYHFPSKVDNINNPEALLSQDGKTVIIDYLATVLSESQNEANIKISVNKK